MPRGLAGIRIGGGSSAAVTPPLTPPLPPPLPPLPSDATRSALPPRLMHHLLRFPLPLPRHQICASLDPPLLPPGCWLLSVTVPGAPTTGAPTTGAPTTGAPTTGAPPAADSASRLVMLTIASLARG